MTPLFSAQYRIFLIIHKNSTVVNRMFFEFFGKTPLAKAQKKPKAVLF